MKKILAGFSAIAMVLSVSASYAANDNVTDAPPMAYPTDTDWTGFFIGASIGRSKGSLSADDGVHLPSANDYDLTDTLIGGQVGFRYQFDNKLVLGTSFSLPLASMDGSAKSTTTATQAYEVEVDSAYLINVMAGLSVGKWLPYASYGIGRAETKNKVLNVGGVAGATQTSEATHKLTAMTFGIKYAIWDNLSIGGALQRVEASQESYAVPLNACCGNAFGLNSNSINFMIDYRF